MGFTAVSLFDRLADERSIDEGACRAIKRKESGSRLLPAGVVRVDGPFASHQAVRLVVRRRKGSASAIPNHVDLSASRDSFDDNSPTPSSPQTPQNEAVSPSANPHAHFTSHLRRPPSLLATAAVAASNSSSPDINAATPGTPTIQPVLSLSSSIASLDPLSRSVPPSPAIHAIAERLSAATISGSLLTHEVKPTDIRDSAPGSSVLGSVQLPTVDETDEWEELEVGKGLAQYNSVEIDRIKGMKR